MPHTGEGWRMTVERDLVEEARRGSADAFAALVHGSIDRLYAVAFRILRDRDQADDAVQQALIDIWDHLPELRDPERYEGWAYRLLVRTCYRAARSRRRFTADVREIDRVEIADPSERDPMIRIVARDELERGFRQLTAEHRAVLVLRFYVGLPVEEIAATLEIPAGTAASRLHYALRELRAACEGMDREEAVGRVWA